jgi:hypothetical protein
MLKRNSNVAPDATVVVCGIERGGTSMVAQTLSALGIFMGDDLQATYEDVQIALSVRDIVSRSSDELIAAFRDLIARRNARRKRWGFKVPNVFQAKEIFSLLRSPVLICVFRDSISIANRRATSGQRDWVAALESTGRLQAELLETFLSTSLPAAGFSYEKALLNPAEFVDELAAVLGIEPSEAERRTAIAGITPSPEAYLKASADAEIVGQIDRTLFDGLFGWLLNVTNDEEIVSASVYIDETCVGVIDANINRPDLVEYCTNNFNHGFRFPLPPHYSDGAEHSARLVPCKPGATRIGGQNFKFRIPTASLVLEEFIKGSLRAWIFRRDCEAANTTVRLLVDDVAVAETKADFPRDDLDAAGFVGAGGIAFDLPADQLDGQIHKVEVQVVDPIEWEVADSPRFMRFPLSSKKTRKKSRSRSSNGQPT